ncbi:hypothetical protein MOQ_000847 [Trypanosoma cruzi marinkellei]|uniref:PSP1 C-terminal domain-containing protein n=1 Tax=Trypanosoma cruzi marinkellei TaxID=85056 RepID=K2PD35_TRYCR|nr:hypothetical protein MOQ_000847 [Trypanosoma cruzi marinkellei]
MLVAPLSDCTAGVIQEANKANNVACNELRKAIRRRHTHNPYLQTILTPVVTSNKSNEKKRHEPNPNAPAFVPAEIPWNTYTPCVYNENSCVNETTYDYAVYGSSYYYSQRMSPSFANTTPKNYQLPSVPTESINTSSVADKTMNLSNNSASCGNTGTSDVSTPVKRSSNLYKMYVDGRPKVVRGVMYAEVKVKLRLGSEVFIVNDVPQVFGLIVNPEDLVGRYVIVEGDRGEDMGIIAAIERSEQEPVKQAEPVEEGDNIYPRVLREALAEDIESFHGLDRLEEEALRFCKAAIHSLKIRTPLQVKRAVFQFDRKKLTFTYSSDSYVEFKVLLRALNRQYQCRIWMHQLNWEANCKPRRQSSDTEVSRKSRRDPRKCGGVKKDGKRSHEADE